MTAAKKRVVLLLSTLVIGFGSTNLQARDVPRQLPCLGDGSGSQSFSFGGFSGYEVYDTITGGTDTVNIIGCQTLNGYGECGEAWNQCANISGCGDVMTAATCGAGNDPVCNYGGSELTCTYGGGGGGGGGGPE